MILTPGGASTAPTTEQLNLLHIWCTAQTGVTNVDQLQNLLNSPTQVANSTPAVITVIPLTAIPKATVQKLMTSIVMGMLPPAATSPDILAYWQTLQAQVNAYDEKTYDIADMEVYLTTAVSQGILTQAQATALTSTTSTAPASPASYAVPLAWTVLGEFGVYVEATDVTAAVAS